MLPAFPAPVTVSMALRRSLGSLQVQLISLGGIIGSSYFLGLGSLISSLGPSVVAAFALGGVIVYLVAAAMGELCAEMPREGSFVSFARELVGAPWAAGVGWSYWIDWCSYIASEMIGGGVILHEFAPAVPALGWSAVLAALVTAMNLLEVRWFGLIDSALSLVKVAAAALFALLGFAIWAGWTGGPFIGARNLGALFPAGGWAVPLSMMIVLVNLAGTELMALSAAESKDRAAIARDCRRVAVSAVLLFVLPLLALVAIFPYRDASLERSAFAAALDSHGLRWAAAAISAVTLSAAFSCANSGLYGTVRALYGLGKEGLAPAAVTRLNHADVPAAATWATIAGCWAFLPLLLLYEGTSFYTWLLAVSGFTGALCWLSISWCHLRFRKARDGRAPLWCYASVALQLGCLGLVPFSREFRGCLVIAIPSLLVPMAVVWLRDRNGPSRQWREARELFRNFRTPRIVC